MKLITLEILENVTAGEYICDVHDGFNINNDILDMSESIDVPFEWGLEKLQEVRSNYTNKMLMVIAKDTNHILLGYNYDRRVTLIAIVFN